MPLGYNVESLGFDTSRSPVTELAKEYFIWPLLAVLYLGLVALYPQLWGLDVLIQIATSSIDLIILAIAITFVLATGEIDISIVGTMGVAPFAAATAIKDFGVPPLLSILVVLPAIAVVIGLGNAFMINKLEIDSLIATLGSYFFLIGVLFALTNGATVTGFGSAYTFIGNNSVFGISLLLPTTLLVAMAAHFILTRTPFGQNLLLTGGDNDSSKRSGINTARVRRNAFVLCAILSAIAGFLLSSQLAIISSTFGQGRLLPAIAAPILGGVLLTGGKASIHQAVGGALLLQMVNTTLTIAGVSGYNVRLYTGVIVLAAIILGSLRIIKEE